MKTRMRWILSALTGFAGLCLADTLVGDTFSWGSGVAGRESVVVGTSINNMATETGNGTWSVTSGTATFDGSSGAGNGKLVMNSSNSALVAPYAAQSTVVALEAEGKFTPGASGTRGFYLGLQAASPDLKLLQNQTTDKIYARIDQAGTVSLVSRVSGTVVTSTGSIPFTSGDTVQMVLTLQPGPKTATLDVNNGELSLSLTWAGTPTWSSFAINQSASQLELFTAGYYKLPKLPVTLPKNMSFRAMEPSNPTGTVVDSLTNALNYPIHHATGSRSYTLKQNDPGALVITTAAWALSSKDAEAGSIWQGYLMYYQGTKMTQNLDTTATKIYVANTGVFKVSDPDTGPDHVIIYRLSNNQPDWSYFEYAQVTNIGSGWVQVTRATSGTTAHSFTANQAVVAPHAAAWMADDGAQQWIPNFSLYAPTNPATGITAAEFFSARVAEDLMTPDANGTVLDGLEHDVFYSNRTTAGRPMDCDNDLNPDWGYKDGVNSFCLGTQNYTRNLRYLIGPDKILQFDCTTPRVGYRGWKYVNGVQMETFMGYDRFSEAMENLSHWVSNAEAYPAFSYGFTKEATETYGGVTGADWKFRVHFAAGLMFGMPHPYSSTQSNGDEWFGFFNWDEEYDGVHTNWDWLGTAVGGAVRDTSNLGTNLIPAGNSVWELALSTGYSATMSGDINGTDGVMVAVSSVQDNTNNWHGVDFQMNTIIPQTQGDEYTLIFTAKGDDVWTSRGQTFEEVPRLIDILKYGGDGMAVLADHDWRTYTLSFVANNGIKGCKVRFGLGDTIGTNWIKNVELKKGTADRWSREFENGVVYLNMSQTAWTNNIGSTQLWKIKGSITPSVNDGSLVTGTFVVPAKDAWFLRKTNPN